MGALTGFRIVELAQTAAGEYCGKLLADFGAQVIKVERPVTGSPTRSLARLPGIASETEASSLFAYLNTNKKSVALDLDEEAGIAAVKALLAGADAVIDDRGAQAAARLGLSPGAIAASWPELVACLITPLGLEAADDWGAAQALNIFHASGWGYHTPSGADPARPPLKGVGCYNASFEAGLDAAIAVLACLYRLGRCGLGELVDISQQAALLNRIDSVLGPFLAGEDTPSRARGTWDMPTPSGSFACADGNVYLFVTAKAHWQGLCKLMGEPEWTRGFAPDWLEFGITDERVATFRRAFAGFVADREKHPISEAAQALGVPLVALNDADDLPRSPQLRHRGFFQTLDHPVLGKADYPTVPYRLGASPVRLVDPAPLLDQHGAQVKAKGWSGERRRRGASLSGADLPPPARDRGGPLAGVRVLELTKVWAGPYAGKLLAFLGAEVIKVESVHNIDEMRAYGGTDIDKAPIFLSLNHEVLSAQFNLKSDRGIALLKDLIARSDMVLNNLRHGALERMGLGFKDMQRINPGIISVSLKMNGNDGPLAYQTGYAPCFAALSGISALVGYEGEPPANVNMRYGDSTAGATMALGALAALLHRERTGEGQFVDVSAVEAMTTMIGDSLLRYSLTGEVPRADGNFHPDMAPHGCYPCKGGRWISLAVACEGQWQAMCGLIGANALSADARFATREARNANRHALDRALSQLTRGQDAPDLASRLRQAGIGASVSLDTVDLVADPHLRRRGDIREVTDAHGLRPIVGPSWKMTRAPVVIARGSPSLGEHNAYVYQTLLGHADREFEELKQAGIVA